jgi:ABC-type transporter Mla subunit MlaD
MSKAVKPATSSVVAPTSAQSWPSLPPTAVWADRVDAHTAHTQTQDLVTHVTKALSTLDTQMNELTTKLTALSQQVLDLAASLDDAITTSVHNIFNDAHYVSNLIIHKDEHEQYTISDLLDRVASLVTHHTEQIDQFDKITDRVNRHSDALATIRTELTKLTRCFGPQKK